MFLSKCAIQFLYALSLRWTCVRIRILFRLFSVKLSFISFKCTFCADNGLYHGLPVIISKGLPTEQCCGFGFTEVTRSGSGFGIFPSSIFVIKTLDPDSDPDSLEMLDPDPDSIRNTVSYMKADLLLSLGRGCAERGARVDLHDGAGRLRGRGASLHPGRKSW